MLHRHELRKKANKKVSVQNPSVSVPFSYKSQEEINSSKHKKNGSYLVKMTIACAILLASIAFQRGIVPVKPSLKNTVSQMLWTDFQFTKVQKWYEKKTDGNPLALLSMPFLHLNADSKSGVKSNSFSAPANGQITKSYTKATNGITIRAQSDTAITAVEDGVITFSGKKQDTGNTIIIQHANGTESLYGRVSSITVKPYQQVTKGEKIAEIHPASHEPYGVFYFAIKKNKHFIDPLQVIPFD